MIVEQIFKLREMNRLREHLLRQQKIKKEQQATLKKPTDDEIQHQKYTDFMDLLPKYEKITNEMVIFRSALNLSGTDVDRPTIK